MRTSLSESVMAATKLVHHATFPSYSAFAQDVCLNPTRGTKILSRTSPVQLHVKRHFIFRLRKPLESQEHFWNPHPYGAKATTVVEIFVGV